MDDILLGFSKEQWELYSKLSEQDGLEIPLAAEKYADRAREILDSADHRGIISELAERALGEARGLIALEKSPGTLFSAAYGKGEIGEIRERYFECVAALAQVRAECYSKFAEIGAKIAVLTSLSAEVEGAYSDFLVYFAAFSERGERLDVISGEDALYREALGLISEVRGVLSSAMRLAELLGDVMIGDFLRSSVAFADSPSFAKFSGDKFFGCVRALAVRLESFRSEVAGGTK